MRLRECRGTGKAPGAIGGIAFVVLLLVGIIIAWSAHQPAWADEGMTEKRKIPDAPAKFLEMKNPFTSPRDIKRGAKQYGSKCADCHGEEGEGDPDEPEVVIFKDKAYMATRADGQLFYIIKLGAGEEAEMEAFGPDSDVALSDKKIWQIIAFIRTLAP